MKKIAVILSGCGYLDGSEITEAISSLICLSQEGVAYECFAPDISFVSQNHLSGLASESRNSLVESARIARGQVRNLDELDASQFDGLLLPGGYGAAKTLCDWAEKGSQCDVLPWVQKSLIDFYEQQKPIAALCIAPAVVARVLGPKGVSVTIGNDLQTALEIEKTGAIHEECPVDEYISDRNHRILTTPAYMYDAKPSQVFLGISKMIREFVEMA
jgi:enhancing lycopene biosynthesis protein 2